MALAHSRPAPRRRHLTLVPPLPETETLTTEPAPYGSDGTAPKPIPIPPFDPDLPVQVQRSLRAAECFLWLPHLLAQLPERCPALGAARRYCADALTSGKLRDACELYTRMYRYLAETNGGADPTGGQGPRPDPLGTPTTLPIREGAR